MTRRQVERLTDLLIKQTKSHAAKAVILPDGKGLRLAIFSNDARYWQLRSTRDGKERTIQLGIYPQMTLAKARRAAEKVRETIAAGGDPITERIVAKAKLLAATGNTFEASATSMLAAKGKNVSVSYLEKIRGAFSSNLYPRIGKMPIQEITSPVLREALRKIEARGSLDMLANVRRWAGEVFDFAKASGHFAGDNPAHCLTKNIFESHTRERMKALPWDEIPRFLRCLDEKRGTDITTIAAIRLLVWTACRSSEVRKARWEEFDLPRAKWTIPAARMKLRKPHIVPLPRQALEVLNELYQLTGYGEYLFPSRPGAKAATISDVALLKAVRRFAGHDNLDVHGFRSVFSTYANEKHQNENVIECALAHGKKGQIKGLYDRATYFSERIVLMQWYADELDKAKTGNVVQYRVASLPDGSAAAR
jgi:integrase